MEKRPDAGDALVSFGIASAVRDVAISVASVLGLLYLFPSWLPSWVGLGVLAACVAVVLLACGLLFRLRDA